MKLRTAGLGQQSSLGRIDAPLGHYIIDGKIIAMLAGPNGDVPPIIGPAGIVHMSILDFANWAGWNAGDGKRKPYLVKPETSAQTPLTGHFDTGKKGCSARHTIGREICSSVGVRLQLIGLPIP